MSAFAIALRALALVGAILYVAPVSADAAIDVSFETGDRDEQKLVHARALFPASGPAVEGVFDRIAAYPELHQWIDATEEVRNDVGVREFVVNFDFPWPVGRQWSRVEVRRVGDAIVWKQVDGTLKANHGCIRFALEAGAVAIDYRAAIDIGLPERLTRSYKVKFVTEFLTAVREKAKSLDRTATLALAD